MTSVPDLPGYRLIRRLGGGGMSQVWLAEQLSVGREVAVKLFDASRAPDQGFATRFLRDGKLCAQLNHTNIVTVYDVGSSNDYFFISLEVLPGGTLEIPEGGLEPTRAVDFMGQLLRALAYAHDKGIVHRDIKPDNILLRDAETPVITDFGIAKALDSGTALTRAGTVLGTALYMSPEQARGRPVDARSDLYSLGIVFFEMLTGHPPYSGDDPFLISIQHVREKVPALPEPLTEYQCLIDLVLAKEPVSRAANATAALQSLESIGRQKRLQRQLAQQQLEDAARKKAEQLAAAQQSQLLQELKEEAEKHARIREAKAREEADTQRVAVERQAQLLRDLVERSEIEAREREAKVREEADTQRVAVERQAQLLRDLMEKNETQTREHDARAREEAHRLRMGWMDQRLPEADGETAAAAGEHEGLTAAHNSAAAERATAGPQARSTRSRRDTNRSNPRRRRLAWVAMMIIVIVGGSAGYGWHQARKRDVLQTAVQSVLAALPASADSRNLDAATNALHAALQEHGAQPALLAARSELLGRLNELGRAAITNDDSRLADSLLQRARNIDATDPRATDLANELIGQGALQRLRQSITKALASDDYAAGEGSVSALLAHLDRLQVPDTDKRAVRVGVVEHINALPLEDFPDTALIVLRLLNPMHPKIDDVRRHRAQQTAAEKNRTVAEELAINAQGAQKAGRYSGDEGAIALWRQVLVLEPDNAAARSGLEGIAVNLLALAQRRIDEREPDKARAILSQVTALNPSLPGLKVERERLDDLRADIVAASANPVPGSPEAERLVALLAAAQTALQRGDLVWPLVDSAYDSWKAALLLAPKNQEALAGLKSLPSRIERHFDAQLHEGALKKAGDLLLSADGIGMMPLKVAVMREQLVVAYVAAIKEARETSPGKMEQLLAEARSYAPDDQRLTQP